VSTPKEQADQLHELCEELGTGWYEDGQWRVDLYNALVWTETQGPYFAQTGWLGDRKTAELVADVLLKTLDRLGSFWAEAYGLEYDDRRAKSWATLTPGAEGETNVHYERSTQ